MYGLPELSLTSLMVAGTVLSAFCAEIEITPKFETAGIIIGSNAEELSLEIKQNGEWRKAHPFVRYDANHMASSLFDLQPDTRYEIRIDGKDTHQFRTLPQWKTPIPKKTVRVSDLASMQGAMDAAEPGTEILLAPGHYRGSLELLSSGTRDAPIVIRGDAPLDGAPINERTDLPIIDAKGESTGIRADGMKFFVIDRLLIKNATNHGVYIRKSWGAVVQNSQILDNGKWNILISKGGDKAGRHLIQNNYIADLQSSGSEDSDDLTYYGIMIDYGGGTGTTIRSNIIEGTADGIASSGQEGEVKNVPEDHPDVVSEWFSREIDIYDNLILRQRDDSIEADGICVNQRVFRNRLETSTNATSISPSAPGPFFFVRNLMLDYQEGAVKLNTGKGRGLIRNVFYYHNVMWPNPDSEQNAVLTLWKGTPSKNITFRNNILFGKARAISFQGLPHRPDMDYDLWHADHLDKAKERFEDYGMSWEPNGIFAEPQLDENYRPKPASPAIDAGIRIPGINDRFNGAAPDVGAYEL